MATRRFRSRLPLPPPHAYTNTLVGALPSGGQTTPEQAEANRRHYPRLPLKRRKRRP